MYSVERIDTILTVPSIEETAAWYERVLGWTGHYDVFDAEGRCEFGSVMWGDLESVMRREQPFIGFNLSRFGGPPAAYSNEGCRFTALIAVDDVDALYARVVENGVIAATAPQNQEWGGRTFSMQDLNGFNLTFYQTVEQVELDEIRRRHEEARKAKRE